MGINANILPVFEQLGLYEEFKEISLPNTSIEILYDNLEKVTNRSDPLPLGNLVLE